MTIQEAESYVGGFVRFNSDGHGGMMSTGRLESILKDRCVVACTSGRKFSVDPTSVKPWKSRNHTEGFKPKAVVVKPPTPTATPIKVSPPMPASSIEIKDTTTAPITGETTLIQMCDRFESAKAELGEWESLVKACEEDLASANKSRDEAFKHFEAIRIELGKKIKFS